MVSEVLFSHKSDEWETPQYVFDFFKSIYKFDFDAAATLDNSKCKNFSSLEDDQEWSGNVWINPPYSKIDEFVDKAIAYTETCDSVVGMLLPSRTGTKWFKKLVNEDRCVFIFIRGRLKFGGATNCAPFDSLFVAIREGYNENRMFVENLKAMRN